VAVRQPFEPSRTGRRRSFENAQFRLVRCGMHERIDGNPRGALTAIRPQTCYMTT
jgi:hypothetical protein